jgi:hypothetical protein
MFEFWVSDSLALELLILLTRQVVVVVVIAGCFLLVSQRDTFKRDFKHQN